MAVFKGETVADGSLPRERCRGLKSTFDAGESWNRDAEELTSHLERATNYLSVC